ncbi:MAG: site-2 protease family protein [Actinobacteria bacterium]|nr:site-2 protease family protein [Actinomycetota bacterium]
MSWLLAFAGFAVLIILHEGGHFAAAKAVGMRVERFSLFFGRPLVSFRRGETEYGIGPIPLGGYVRISGMNPRETLPPEVAARSYYRQPVWKRVVVIAAGPAVNVLLAFLILWALFLVNGEATTSQVVSSHNLEQPAARYLQPGDRLVSVDGVRGDVTAMARQVASHRCAGRPVAGCVATTPARLVVLRDGTRLTFDVRPRYDATRGIERTRLGFTYVSGTRDLGPVAAAGASASGMWDVTNRTLSVFAHIFQARERKQVGSVVGAYEVTRQSIGFSTERALEILALISLSLAIINLFPFLPLDGGHIFWALAEKVRGRAIPFAIMERASVIGFALVIMLFVIGLTNDIGRFQNGGFNVR